MTVVHMSSIGGVSEKVPIFRVDAITGVSPSPL